MNTLNMSQKIKQPEIRVLSIQDDNLKNVHLSVVMGNNDDDDNNDDETC